MDVFSVVWYKKKTFLIERPFYLGFYQFVQILESVAKKCGCEVRKADRFFASSQTCSNCGNINKQVKDLRIRMWQCNVCNTIHDRDRNAAINILNVCV